MRSIWGVSIFVALIVLLLTACGPNVPATPTLSVVKAQGGGISAVPTPTVILSVANSPSDPSIPPACTPYEPTISDITSFCANKAAGVGGATVEIHAFDITFDSTQGHCTADTTDGFKLICVGPQNGTIQIGTCGTCGPGDPPGSAVFGDYTCAKGYKKNATGGCIQATSDPTYSICPSGSHFDNDAQYCLDNATDAKIPDLCPPGTVTYLPDYHSCLTKHYWQKYNCQTWDIPLGSCAPKVKKPEPLVAVTVIPTLAPPR